MFYFSIAHSPCLLLLPVPYMQCTIQLSPSFLAVPSGILPFLYIITGHSAFPFLPVSLFWRFCCMPHYFPSSLCLIIIISCYLPFSTLCAALSQPLLVFLRSLLFKFYFCLFPLTPISMTPCWVKQKQLSFSQQFTENGHLIFRWILQNIWKKQH